MPDRERVLGGMMVSLRGERDALTPRVLSVEHLTKRYGPRHAVDNLSFEVGEGEIVGFLGPNGAGKTTTLRMITGFLAPSSGAVQVRGIDAIAKPKEARQHIGYMPEGVPLYPEMRVYEYLRYRGELKGIPKREREDALDRALAQAGVEDAVERIIGHLSKGYRQRVGLADALLADPPLLILDEPTSGLDPNQIRGIRELIRGFAGKKTVFVSTHILPEVEATCERVVILNQGRLVGEGGIEELRASAGQEVGFVASGDRDALQEALIEAGLRDVDVFVDGEVLRGRAKGEGVVSEKVFAAAGNAGAKLRELKPGSLEEVFAGLTQVGPDWRDDKKKRRKGRATRGEQE